MARSLKLRLILPGLFRLFLAFVVVIHHSFPLRLGAWAVAMFFILSGFWISRMWRASYSRKPSPYRTFVISRWWRIAPLFVAVQLIAAALVLGGNSVVKPSEISDWCWWATQPTVVGSTQFGRLLPPSWSLDVEMQFYLIAPFVVAAAVMLAEQRRRRLSVGSVPFAVKRENLPAHTAPSVLSDEQSLEAVANEFSRHGKLARSAALLTVVGLGVWCVWRLEHGATLETPRLDVFAWLFLIGVGCELANWRPSATAALASGLLLIAVIGLTYANAATRHLVWVRGAEATSREVTSQEIWGSLFFVSTALVALPLAMRTVHQRSSSWDRWLGDLSYPLYLFHWIPRDWYYANMDLSLGVLQTGGLLFANIAMAFGGAIVLLQCVDRPIQKWRQRWLKGRTAGQSVVCRRPLASE